MPLLLHDLTRVVKHGTHDQSTHGSWAQGRSVSSLVDESIRRAGIGRQLDVDAMNIGLPPGHQDSATPQEDLAKIVEAQGWNLPAPLLSDEEFEEAYATGKFTTVYRTGPVGLEQGILNGTPYVGEGLYGVGTYVTDNPVGVLGYVRNSYGQSVVPMLVPTEMLQSAASMEPESPGVYLREAAAAGNGALFTRNMWGESNATEFVIYNTSALLVGQPSEFSDTRLTEYVLTKPNDEPLPWARFEKMVDGWEGGPYYALVDGKAVPVEFDDDVEKHKGGEGHDQKSHGSWARGSGSITPLGDGRFRYEYGAFSVEADPLAPEAITEELGEDFTFSDLTAAGEMAADYVWNQWEGNFAIRNIAEDMMGIGDRYSSGGEGLDEKVANGIAFGESSDGTVYDEKNNQIRPVDEVVEESIRRHAPLAHAMLTAVHDAEASQAEPWTGLVRRAMVVPSFRSDDENPLLRMYEGDEIDLGLSGFSPNVTLTDKFLRGGFGSREVKQSEDDFVLTPRWRSVMFELDTSQARTVLPSGWGELMSDTSMWSHTSYEDRAADLDEGSMRRTQAAPWEVITAGKFRIADRRVESRTFTIPFSGGETETEDMVVYRIEQTATFNPATGSYEAMDGFVTLPDGQIVPVGEA